MRELRLRVQGSYGPSDLIARIDASVTIGQLADEIERVADQAGDRPRTIKRLSRSEVDFARDDMVAATDIRSGDEISLALDSGVRSRAFEVRHATLRVVEGPDAGRAFELHVGESTIGRSGTCDLVLNDDMASRRHATFRTSDIVEVADAGSTNGVLVNGEQITSTRRLERGDLVRVGDTVLLVEHLAGAHGARPAAGNVVEFNRPPRVDHGFEARSFMVRPPSRLAADRRLSRLGRAKRPAELLLEDPMLQEQFSVIAEALEHEARHRQRLGPSTSELLTWIGDLSPRLWERSSTHRDFLSLRAGVRAQPSATKVEIETHPDPELMRVLQRRVVEFETISDVPVSLNAREQSPVGLAGPASIANGIARSFVVQAAALHPPAELEIATLLTAESAREWDWLKWLPHSRDLLAVGADDGQALVQQLLARTGTHTRVEPHVFLVIDPLTLDRSEIDPLLALGPKSGVTLLWVTEDARQLPTTCRSVLAVEPGGTTATLGDSVVGRELGGIEIETITTESAEMAARLLAPIVESARAATGVGSAMTEVKPSLLATGHGLVAAPSHAALTNFLCSNILAMAAIQPCDELHFLLIESGGHETFRGLVDEVEAGVVRVEGLHHVAGHLCDLTPELARRALRSLEAEIRRRQEVDHAELVVIIDEVVALAAALPDFVDGLRSVEVAGRHLGIRLLLGTARPDHLGGTPLDVEAGVRFEAGPSLQLAEFLMGDIRWIRQDAAAPDPDGRLVSILQREVATRNEAQRTAGYNAPRRPILEPLPSAVNLLDLPRPMSDNALPFALSDLPDVQSRGIGAFEPDVDGHLLIVGAAQRGKTTALRSLAAAFGLTKDRSLVQVHCIDDQTGGLRALSALPHVNVIDRDDTDSIGALLALLTREVAERVPLFAQVNVGSLEEHRQQTGLQTLPRIVVFIDSFDELMQLGEFAAQLSPLFDAGRRVGVHFVLSAGTEHVAADVRRLWLHATGSPGRGYIDSIEVQCAVVGVDPDQQSQALAGLGAALSF